MSIQQTSSQENNIITEIETLKSIFPTIEEVTEKQDLEYVKLQIRLFPKLTQTSYIAKVDDINALTIFEIPRDFPLRPVKVSLEEFSKLSWEKTEILRKKVAEFSLRKTKESISVSATVYVMQVTAEIEEGLYYAKHGDLNIWTENRLKNNGNTNHLEFINNTDDSQDLCGDGNTSFDSRILSRSHVIVQVKVKQHGWCKYLARTEQGDLRIIDHITVDLKSEHEKQQSKGTQNISLFSSIVFATNVFNAYYSWKNDIHTLVVFSFVRSIHSTFL